MMIKLPRFPRLHPEQRRRWHIDRGIPIATIILLLAYLFGGIWGAAVFWSSSEANEKARITALAVQSATDKRQENEMQRMESRLLAVIGKCR